MMKKHITVCICTYKRPLLLKRLLEALCVQETEDVFEVSVSIVDNDAGMSAKSIVDDFSRNRRLEIVYENVRERNLALIRNISIKNSRGDFVAFIDDDEYPTKSWLLFLYKTLVQFQASGALGPVLPDYQAEPPKWIIVGGFCERPRYTTGHLLQSSQTRTGNALVKRDAFSAAENLFNMKFSLGGEDDSFFENLICKGHKFVWSDEAIVYEVVPCSRLNIQYFIKRSRLIGYMTYRYYRDTRSWHMNLYVIIRSVFICIIYLLSLPFNLIRGFHYFADVLIRLNYHKAFIATSLGLLVIDKRDI